MIFYIKSYKYLKSRKKSKIRFYLQYFQITDTNHRNMKYFWRRLQMELHSEELNQLMGKRTLLMAFKFE